MSSLVGYASLEFDLPGALLQQLVGLFDRMTADALTSANLSQVKEVQGVYQLFLDGELKYVGKTDSDAGLHKRLVRHALKIQGRPNLDPSRVTFKAVHIYVFTAVDLEALLIRHYGLTSDNSWNNSGFGSNDPGRERDTTKLKPSHFDKQFPISLDIAVQLDRTATGSPVTAHQVLTELKSHLPYVIRSEAAGPRTRSPHPDLDTTSVTLAKPIDSVENILTCVGLALGNAWQITALPGYVIIYKESATYKEGRILSP